MKRLVEWWRKREERRRKEKEEYNKESVIQKASELFQICEHGHLIWFTFDGRLVCPITMFDCDDPVAVIGAMRDLYISEYLGK
jgi:hypothetical protein